MKYDIIEELPSVLAIANLRRAIGWKEIHSEVLQKELRRTLYGIHVRCDEKVVGAARMVGDGQNYFHICDVMVWPDYQNRGIGSEMLKRIMQYIEKNAKTGAVIGLIAAEGKRSFYERFGFQLRTNPRLGYEMVQYLRV